MGRKINLYAIVILVLFANISFVSASFTLGNLSQNIADTYSPGEKIKGWINISFQNEPSDSVLSGNLGGNISLINFLGNNSADYTCNPESCVNDYSAGNGEMGKSFNLSYLEERLLSFKLNGLVSQISGVEFDVSSSNADSCVNPLEIDFLDNGVDWNGWKFSDDYSCTYQGGMGCYNPAESTSEVGIGSVPYCEKIGLVKSGKFKIGAWINGSSSQKLTAELYNLDNQKVAGCDIAAGTFQGEEASCNVNYNTSGTGDYYVCIKSAGTGYKTRMESVNPCGFFAVPGTQSTNYDYYIFARGAKFANVGKFRFNQAEYRRMNAGEMKTDAFNYLRERYACIGTGTSCVLNCSMGCVIPVKFKAYGDTDMEISNISIGYLTGGPITEDSVYDSGVVKPGINSAFLEMDLGKANLSSSGSYGTSLFRLYLAGNEVLSKQITVAKIPVINELFPTSVPAGVLMKFTVNVSSPGNKNITKYIWTFDTGSEETSVNYVYHSYSETGSYTLGLKVRDDSGQEASRNFTIISGNPRDIANSTLKDYRSRINNVITQISSEPGWYKITLDKELGIDELNDQLTSLEKKFETASSDGYVQIMLNLSGMEVPKEIKKSNRVNFPVSVSAEDISLDKLGELGAGSYDSGQEDAIKQAILNWKPNLDLSADYFKIMAYYDNDVKNVLSYYDLKIAGNEDIENYLIVNDKVVFKTQDNTKEWDDASGVKFSTLEDREVELVTAGDEGLNLKAYLSPEFLKLEIPTAIVCNNNGLCEKDSGENWKNCRSDCKPWGLAVFYFLLLLFAAFISYLFLQRWYKEKYESHLFKNKNDLFNLVNFINNSIVSGIERGQINGNLKKAGWSSEQISYAMKKVKGRNTGMPIEFGKKKQDLKRAK